MVDVENEKTFEESDRQPAGSDSVRRSCVIRVLDGRAFLLTLLQYRDTRFQVTDRVVDLEIELVARTGHWTALDLDMLALSPSSQCTLVALWIPKEQGTAVYQFCWIF